MSSINWYEVLVAAGCMAVIGGCGSLFLLATPNGRVIWNYWGGTPRRGTVAGVALALSLAAMFVAFVLPWDTPLWMEWVGVAAAAVAALAGITLVVAAVDIYRQSGRLGRSVEIVEALDVD